MRYASQKFNCLSAVVGIGMACLYAGAASARDLDAPETPGTSWASDLMLADQEAPLQDRVLSEKIAVMSGDFHHDPEPEKATSRIKQPASIAVESGKTDRGFAQEWQAVSLADLDDARGGFDTAQGLKISFGIERAVYINGNLATTSNMTISEPGKLTSEQASAPGTAVGTVTLVQNGPGNSFQLGALAPGVAATVVQNTLNNQQIHAVTVINSTVNSLEVLKGMNFNASLQDALISSVGSR